MTPDTDKLKKQATILLQSACSPYGILASPNNQDNYRRLWARDSMIAGIAGILAGDEKIISGFKRSIHTLAKYQHPYGMIPSNVLPHASNPEISYGGLAGRVDATTWFLAGTCLYLSFAEDLEFKSRLQPHLLKALEILNRWEFNGKGLLYTPLSGNWADEYPIQGHTLYDNCLRVWGLEGYAALFDDEQKRQQAKKMRECIKINFWPDKALSDRPEIYHQKNFEETKQKQLTHFACSIDPKGYNLRFDAAGHGLALLIGIVDNEQKNKIQQYVEGIFNEIGANLLPAFWPVIASDDPDWFALQQNYSFEFKNKPYHFHNGGIWPVWMGLFALGMKKEGSADIAKRMLQAWMDIENLESLDFAEYIASDTLVTGGKQGLSYSASGLIFLLSAIESNDSLKYLEH